MHAARNMKGRRGKDAEEEWKRKRGIAYFPSKPIVTEKEHVSVGLRFQSASETDTTRTGIWSVATNGTVGAVEGPARKKMEKKREEPRRCATVAGARRNVGLVFVLLQHCNSGELEKTTTTRKGSDTRTDWNPCPASPLLSVTCSMWC
ncbi:hypothetical protein GW17_00015277 [Ensete ventricosum]|nr:hypothetical protein GW17_00015277 [Ensete ventricosum]RZS06677.1 hypothetical protein BHM03_00037379 [Ensete ventricosum]